jgi:hypothetical protein
MRSGGVVVASDIPVHREIYADAAEYFSPYSVEELARAIQCTIDPVHHRRRDELVTRGALVSARYTHDKITPLWRSFLSGPAVTFKDGTRPRIAGELRNGAATSHATLHIPRPEFPVGKS